MTLAETIDMLEALATMQPAVKTIVKQDVYRLNEDQSVKYGVFAWLQREHRESIENDWREYAFTLFYIDRLRSDNGNELEVQSVGIEVLSNLLRYIAEYTEVEVGEWTIQPFTQKFNDLTAGVYVNVTLGAALDYSCPEDFIDPIPPIK